MDGAANSVEPAWPFPAAPLRTFTAMRSLLPFAVLGLLVLTPAARAEVFVQTPWVTVRVGPAGVFVRAPGVMVNVPGCAAPVMPPAAAPAATPELPPPRRMPADPPAVPPPAPAAVVPTLAQFASAFTPQPGHYEVVLLHPATGQPVKVGFTLPPGTPRQVRVFPYRLAFDYGRQNVVLVFQRNGGVRVRD
jgi:hypothetical protein